LEETNIFTPYYVVDVLMSVIAIIFNVYAFFSLKKTFNHNEKKYLSYFSKGFLFFAISTSLSLFSFITIILVSGAVGNSPYFNFYVDLPYSLAFFVGLVYFMLGVKNTKALRAA
jgi:hypothetical protein